MKLSDAKERRRAPVIADKRKESRHEHWSEKQKVELITLYRTTGNLALACRMLNIPEVTGRKWKATSWWKEIFEEQKHQETVELSSKLKGLIEKSLNAVEDRLVNGDFFYDQKTGEMVRRPVPMRDANKVAMDMVQKRELLENRDQLVTLTQDSIEAKLLKLAEKFAELAQGKRPKSEEVIDVEVKERSSDLEHTGAVAGTSGVLSVENGMGRSDEAVETARPVS